MLAVKGRFNGTTVVLDSIPNSKELGAPIKECEVIVNFPDVFKSVKTIDDGSLAYLFKDYVDDGIREPIVDFGSAVGNEQW
ncbi:MAG: hypothetical protein LBV17_09310 [Treponema sp.]|jgi:hypothetical protein|nr:hypothetical protein [Treponema sp.]